MCIQVIQVSKCNITTLSQFNQSQSHMFYMYNVCTFVIISLIINTEDILSLYYILSYQQYLSLISNALNISEKTMLLIELISNNSLVVSWIENHERTSCEFLIRCKKNFYFLRVQKFSRTAIAFNCILLKRQLITTLH